MTTGAELAAAFRRQHRPQDGDILILPNAWDALSARVIEHAGARAIATTSAGVSWTLGRPDGQGVARTEMIDAVRRIAEAVQVPVTADIESGYGSGSPEHVAATVRGVADAGAVGINLEDAPGRGGEPMLRPEEHASRIAAARTAGGPELFINARVDVYLRQVGAESGRFEETVRRGSSGHGHLRRPRRRNSVRRGGRTLPCSDGLLTRRVTVLTAARRPLTYADAREVRGQRAR